MLFRSHLTTPISINLRHKIRCSYSCYTSIIQKKACFYNKIHIKILPFTLDKPLYFFRKTVIPCSCGCFEDNCHRDISVHVFHGRYDFTMYLTEKEFRKLPYIALYKNINIGKNLTAYIWIERGCVL